MTDERTVFFLPRVIDHDGYRDIVSAMEKVPRDTEIILHCSTDGGNTDAGVGIAEYIKSRGNVIGLLFGGCHSIGSYIYACCSRRFVSENSVMGIHPPSFSWDGYIVKLSAQYLLDSLQRTEDNIVRTLADASGDLWDVSWWSDMINRATYETLTEFTGAELVHIGFSEPMTVYYEMRNK